MNSNQEETTRAQILETAAELFRGSASAARRFTVNELSEHLELHHTAIYHYFESKDHIVKELIDAGCARRIANLRQAQQSGSTGLDQLLQFIQLELAEPPTDLLVRPTLLLKSPYREQAELALRATSRHIEQHIEAGIADGSIRECKARIVAGLLTRILNRYLNQREPHLMGSGLTPLTIAEQVVQFVRSGVAADPLVWKHLADIEPVKFPTLTDRPSQLTDIQRVLTEAFNEVGYDGTSIPRVAASIGLSKTSFYKYGPSKGDLLYLCARQSIDLTTQIRQISKIVAQSPLQALLYNIYYSRCLQKDSPGPYLLPAHYHFLSIPQQNIVWRMFEDTRDSLRNLLEAGMSSGEIRALDASAIAPMLAISSLIRIDYSNNGFIDEVARFFLSGVASHES